ncbi:aminopeptidase P N-terminal domain-containing protein [Flavobacteriales bacterium]|nr:aminopeptidase P N-terminal domain-containing protein [Flavobacteriales bacterium]
MKNNLLILIISTLLCFSQSFSQEKVIKLDNKVVTPNHVGIYDTDLLPSSFHKERREKLRNLLPDSSVAILYSSPIRNRSNDVDYEYHQDPNFYYLTGLIEPHSVIIIYKEKREINGVMTNEIAFVQPRDASKELWMGKRMGVDGVKQILDIETVLANKKIKDMALNLTEKDKVFFIADKNDTRDTRSSSDLYDTKQLLNQLTEKTTQDNYKLNKWMAQLREIKTEEELLLMRKAIDITCKAQIELMKKLNPDMAEYQSEALVEYHFKNEGAEHAGFPSIHGSGGNSCILHYVSNRRMFEQNDLLVSDIGAEYHGYTADVTRTLPVNGTYSKEQTIIYNIVLEAQTAGIKACVEGNSFWKPGQIANEIITKRLLELGIIKKASEVKKYFPHGTSHYLGLDVHDAGMYNALQAMQVITVEPGIYIPEGSDCDEKWWNIGVRIEDDILITNMKPINLSGCVPRTIKEIEEIMKKK